MRMPAMGNSAIEYAKLLIVDDDESCIRLLTAVLQNAGYSRLNSLTSPVEIEPGMVFALETYCPAADGFSAARIEEEVVVTEDGVHVITKFPAQDLFVTHPY